MPDSQPIEQRAYAGDAIIYDGENGRCSAAGALLETHTTISLLHQRACSRWARSFHKAFDGPTFTTFGRRLAPAHARHSAHQDEAGNKRSATSMSARQADGPARRLAALAAPYRLHGHLDAAQQPDVAAGMAQAPARCACRVEG